MIERWGGGGGGRAQGVHARWLGPGSSRSAHSRWKNVRTHQATNWRSGSHLATGAAAQQLQCLCVIGEARTPRRRCRCSERRQCLTKQEHTSGHRPGGPCLLPQTGLASRQAHHGTSPSPLRPYMSIYRVCACADVGEEPEVHSPTTKQPRGQKRWQLISGWRKRKHLPLCGRSAVQSPKPAQPSSS